MPDDRADRGARSGAHRARHRGNGPATAKAPQPVQQPETQAGATKQRPPNPLATAPLRRTPRDTLTPLGAARAVRFTRWTFAAVDVTFGAAFWFDVPTNSATFRAMQAALLPVLGDYSGMWVWGTILVIAGLLIPTGQIAVAGPIGAFGWGAFAVFNLLSLSTGALAVQLFAGVAVLHVGMGWFIVRDRRRQSPRQASRQPSRGTRA